MLAMLALKVKVNIDATAAGAAPTTIDGVGGNAMAEVETLKEAMEDRFVMMQVQMGSLTASFTVCPCTTGDCPCACSKGAPVKEPPTRGRRPEEDEWTKKDPWTRPPRRGDDGDGDDGDGGDEGDGADDDYFIGTPGGRAGRRGPKKAHEYEHGKLFEANDAKCLP